MNLPIPTPTKEQLAASEELEGSRAQYNLQKRLEIFLMHKPDTVTAAQIGDPPLEDATPTTAPQVLKSLGTAYIAAFNPGARPAEKLAPAATSTDAPATETPAAPAAPAAPLSLSDVPAAGQGGSNDSTTTMTPAAPSSGGSGTGIGAEILSSPSSVPPSDLPAATGDKTLTTASRPLLPRTRAPCPQSKKRPTLPTRSTRPKAKKNHPPRPRTPTAKSPRTPTTRTTKAPARRSQRRASTS